MRPWSDQAPIRSLPARPGVNRCPQTVDMSTPGHPQGRSKEGSDRCGSSKRILAILGVAESAKRVEQPARGVWRRSGSLVDSYTIRIPSVGRRRRSNVTLATMSATTAGESAHARKMSKGAITAACIGNAAEWYDFAIFGALASVVGLVFFPSDDSATALSAAFAVYGTALVVRPLGALVFGRLGDTRGRRTVLITVVFLMTGATAAVGMLPGYATIGVLAPILLMVLRGAQGLAAGGELGAAAVFILESARSTRRGEGASWQTATMAVGIGTGMAVPGVLAYLFLEDGLASGWWRVAFLLALPLGLIGVRLRRRVAETQQFAVLHATSRLLEHPAREIWKHHRGATMRGFSLIAAGSLAFNIFFIFLPNNLISRGADLSPTLLVTSAALTVAAVAAVALGILSDRIGRRPVALCSGFALVVLPVPATVLATRGSLLDLLLAQVLVGMAVAGVLSVAMLGEAFPAPVRSTGVAFTAGIATALVGGTAPWIAQIVVKLTGSEAAPGLYVVAIGCLALVALRGWPETAFTDLD
jgi:MHS family proline/betaine transporter-like MFS transporter